MAASSTIPMMTDHADPTQVIVCSLRTGGVLILGPLTLRAASANRFDAMRRTRLLTFRPRRNGSLSRLHESSSGLA